MNRRTGFSLAAFAAILLLFSTLPSAFAQDRDDYYQDPPGRAGRVSYTSGSVSFQPAGEGDWLDAVPNRPLATGDNLWADRDARAEVQIGSTSIRLGSETSVTLSDLDNNVTQLRLSMGTLFFRVRHVGSDDTFEIDTPNLAFNVTQPGEYRVDVNENGDQTTAIVWNGAAEITGGGSSYRLDDGQQGTFYGVEQLRYDVGEIGRDDDFSRWCLDRDRRSDRVRSAEYVSPEITGYEDLDEYGRWYDEPGYGHVWTPVKVSSDWAPYRYGHWVYISPWGWTWVEDEPWGFAPFHYGRWAYLRHGWCWIPGPIAVVPVYSPALVVFIGGGGVHFGGGYGVGWFPLGPGEVYVPWYRTSPRYVQNVNISNTRVTNIQVTNVYNNVTVNKVTNITYVNQRQGRGVTVVNQQTFVNAQPVNNHIMRVDAREVQRAPVTHEFVRNIQPQRQSVFGAARPVRYTPPQQVMARPVMATRQPVMVNRSVPVQGISRPAPQPEYRKVDAAPRGQAQPLQRGARGSSPGFGNARGNNVPANAGRPMPPPDNRRNGTPFGAPGTSAPGAGTPMNPANRPGVNVPRPGGPQNGVPQNGMPNNDRGLGRDNGPRNIPENRPNTPSDNAPQNNAPVARPNAPDMNRPPQDNNRPAMPNSNRPSREVPRPPDQSQGRQGQPQGNPDRPQMRPQAPQGNAQPDQPRPNAPYTRPQQPDTSNRNVPEPARPIYRNPPDNGRQDSNPTPQMRPQSPPPQRDVRPEPAPRPQESRPEPPQTRRESSPPPQMRNEPPSRPPETHSAPPPQRESRPAESRQEKGGSADRGNKDKEPPKYR